MKEAIYIVNLPHSAAVKQEDAIRSAIRQVVDLHPSLGDADEAVDAVARCVVCARAAEDVQGEAPGTFRCVGFRFYLNPVQVSLALTGGSGNLQNEIVLIQEGIARVKVECPPITFNQNGFYLPCGTCGGYTAVVELADLLENLYCDGRNPVDYWGAINRGQADSTSFTFIPGQLNILEAPDTHVVMAEFARNLRCEIIEHDCRKPGERM